METTIIKSKKRGYIELYEISNYSSDYNYLNDKYTSESLDYFENLLITNVINYNISFYGCDSGKYYTIEEMSMMFTDFNENDDNYITEDENGVYGEYFRKTLTPEKCYIDESFYNSLIEEEE